MKKVSYKIIPKHVPAIHLINREQDNFKTSNNKRGNRGRRTVDTECLACEYISDGNTTIKLSDLVNKLRNKKEIKLVPLSLSYTENTTEFIGSKEDEAYSFVSVHVCVESPKDRMIPYQITCYSKHTNNSFKLKAKEEFDEDEDLEQFVVVQLYPIGKDKNVIEINLDISSIDDLKDDCWFCLIPKCVFGIAIKLSIYGIYNDSKYLIYELENNNLQQNQKITVLNYL